MNQLRGAIITILQMRKLGTKTCPRGSSWEVPEMRFKTRQSGFRTYIYFLIHRKTENFIELMISPTQSEVGKQAFLSSITKHPTAVLTKKS